MAANNDNSQLKTGFNEPSKSYLVYTDGLLTSQYEARANAQDGDPCFLTQYTYVTATSRVEKILESNATWDEDWDIA
jgi:hypothetical protein